PARAGSTAARAARRRWEPQAAARIGRVVHDDADSRWLQYPGLVSRRPPGHARGSQSRSPAGCPPVRLLSLSEWIWSTGELGPRGFAVRLLHAADGRFQERRAEER